MAQNDLGGRTVDLTRADAAGNGDDVLVTPEPPTPPRPHRRPRWIVLAVVAAAALAVVTVMTVRSTGNREQKANNVAVDTPDANTATNAHPAAKNAAAPRAKKATAPKKSGRVVPAPVATTVPIVNGPDNGAKPNVVVAPPAPAKPTRPTVPPAAVVKTSPVRALAWTGTSSITVPQGQTRTVTVTAHNPTAGVVSLPHPLSCTPRLQHDEVCPAVVQLIAPNGSARATYTIDANGVAPGTYTLAIEGSYKITVNVE